MPNPSSPNPQPNPSDHPNPQSGDPAWTVNGIVGVEPTPEPPAPAAKLTATQKVQAFRQRYAKWEVGVFFSAGFLFDVFTLSRIDNVGNLIQQGVYLAVLSALLLWDQRVELRGVELKGWIGKAFRFRNDAIHFLFGSLLSAYALFYFKSASGVGAMAFLVVLFFLLVANESERFRSLGPTLRAALLGFCVTSYLAYLVPVLAGFISPWLFVVAIALSSGLVWGMYKLHRRWTDDRWVAAKRSALPAGGVQAVLLGLYLLSAIPPVPLSVEHIGIYHSVAREDGKFKLSHERPDWKVWHSGDQLFKAREGDRVYVFARIFAPTHFKDRVMVRWTYDDPKLGWVPYDAIPLTVTGGRDEGYRGYAYKANYVPGDWKVEIETEDGRTIGQIRFTIEEDPATGERVWKTELH